MVLHEDGAILYGAASVIGQIYIALQHDFNIILAWFRHNQVFCWKSSWKEQLNISTLAKPILNYALEFKYLEVILNLSLNFRLYCICNLYWVIRQSVSFLI